MLRHCYGLVVGLWLVAAAPGASWTEGLFTELSKDFGTVPRGPTLSHPFHIKNNTSLPVHIAGVRASCGCVSAAPLQDLLAPGQETVLLAQMDTRRFSGVKTVTIYVSFDRPHYEEVRLWVQANSRDDVSVSPDTIHFGQIKRGSAPTAKVNLTFYGSSQWQVQAVQCESNYVRCTSREVRRDQSEVAYLLTVQLRSDAPAGKWYTDIWLKTNNSSTPRVRVPVTVDIESALSVSPSVVDLGQVKVGNHAERKVIVRGARPFKVTAVKGADDELMIRGMSTESRSVHVLAITWRPVGRSELKRQLKILTDLKDENEIEIQAQGQITP